MTHFKTIKSAMKTFLADKSGTTPIEYGIIGLVVSTAVIGGASTIGSSEVLTFASLKDIWSN
ncbi:MAG: Flp family type IVb pilin [Pseudomonadota bacterium]